MGCVLTFGRAPEFKEGGGNSDGDKSEESEISIESELCEGPESCLSLGCGLGLY